MKAITDWLIQLPLVNLAVIAAFAVIGAALPKDLTMRERLGTFFIGFLAALVFGEPIRGFLGLGDSWAYGMAGILAMTGRNIAVFVIRASRNPTRFAREVMEIWRGPRR